MLSPLQPVSPLHQSRVDGQQFPVPHVVVVFRRGETPGQKRDGMYLLVLPRPLGTVRAICPVSEASTSTMNCCPGSGKISTGADVNNPFRARKASSAAGDQEKGRLMEVKADQWGGHLAEAPNEPPVEVREPPKKHRSWVRSVGRGHSSTARIFLGSARTRPSSGMCPRNSTELVEKTHFSALTNSLFSNRRCSTCLTWRECSGCPDVV